MRDIKRLMEYETAGDPMNGSKWSRKTTEKIACVLNEAGIEVSKNTVGRLLRQLGFSLRVNHKELSSGTKIDRSTRNKQFSIIEELRDRFAKKGAPVVSVDTKKKELIGNFKNQGATWRGTPLLVNDHDFRSDAEAIAVPYGIHDTIANEGHVCVGQSHDTAEFAVEAISCWWSKEGSQKYPNAKKILILADAGGSNNCRARTWKYWLQKKLCNPHRIAATVSHYPPGASKWNPIEHRLFSEISKNWAGIPLQSFRTMLNYIRTTTTKSGLRVSACYNRKAYQKGIKISDDQMSRIKITPLPKLPQWNYTIYPQKM